MLTNSTAALPTPDQKTLQPHLERVSSLHDHLCPRQVLGVRMGLAGAVLLGLTVPQVDKRLLVVMETDGCGADGVSAATNCWVGRRTMRIEDYGKMAATFVDTATGAAWRLLPHAQARATAVAAAPDHPPWDAMLEVYQRLPTSALLSWQRVRLTADVARLVSRPGARETCARCAEEIMNEREVTVGGEPWCRPCAEGLSYYELVSPSE